MSRSIDLNADLGEYDDAASLARDVAIMAQISSANIACGGHAGNERTMGALLDACLANGVAAGAHPSYPDRANFGRTSMKMADDALAATLTEQIMLLKAHADARGVKLTHVKPHGQLYNDAADSLHLATLIAHVVARTLPEAAYVGLAKSEMATAAKGAGLRFIAEGFADRRYNSRGRLVSRKDAGAVLENEAERVAQALDLARGEPIHSKEGSLIDLDVDSICLHSDSDGALASARDIRAALDKAGIKVTARR
ncbi:MAG TPA: 5-oxoprolinase subunit PxpA [Sphingorhabdus sp.]|nr:5-oxoprolinase subunit PxpA [Sphingorhabdus sp.]